MSDLGEIAGGRYTLRRLLGSGGSAAVYEAWDTALDIRRAIKVLTGDVRGRKSLRRRLKAEAKAMARLSHPNILKIYDIGVDGDHDYVVMELATGGSLQDVLDASGPFPPGRACAYLIQVLSALAAAHSQGIVHRDVKPQNILLDTEGGALLADFGIALLAEGDDRSTRHGVAMGSLAFMAPEQRLDARSVGPAADLYASATTLYNLITGENPIDLFTADVRSERWRGIPEELLPILMKGVELQPDERFRDAKAMAAHLIAVMTAIGHIAPAAKKVDYHDPEQFPEPSHAFTDHTAGGVTGGDRADTAGSATAVPAGATALDPATHAAVTFFGDEIWDTLSALPPLPNLDTLVTPAPIQRKVGDREGAAASTANTVAAHTVSPPAALEEQDPGLLVPPAPERGRRWPVVVLGLGVAVGLTLGVALFVWPEGPWPSEDGAGLESVAGTAEASMTPAPEASPQPSAPGEGAEPPEPVGPVDRTEPDPVPGSETEGRPVSRVETAPVPAPVPVGKPSEAPSQAGVVPLTLDRTLGAPLGLWRGNFGGRIFELQLTGQPDAIRGTSAVRFGGNVVNTPVVGRYDSASREIVLEDQIESADAGRYVGTLASDHERIEGTWTGFTSQRTLSFSVRRAP